MRKCNLLFVLLFMGLLSGNTILSAQESLFDRITNNFTNIDYRLEIGPSASIITGMNARISPIYFAKLGFSGSATFGESNFGFESGLYITKKGVALTYTEENGVKNTIYAKPVYIDLPINFCYRIDLKNSSCLYINAGPYLALGISGKFKFKGPDFESLSSIPVYKVSSRPISRFDTGIGASLLYENYDFTLRVGAELGLYPITHNIDQPDGIDYWQIRNDGFFKNIYPVNAQAFIMIGYRISYF